MEKHAVAERILKIVQNQTSGFGSAKDGFSMFGQPQSLQQDMVRAIDLWMRQNEKEPVLGFVMMLQTMNILFEEATNTLIDQINDAS
jgi:hypothetical protein